MKISSIPAETDHTTAEAACAANQDKSLTIRSFFLYEGIKAYLASEASTSSFWVGKWADVMDEPITVKDLWSETGRDGIEECVLADQTDGYRLKRVPC